MVYLTRVEHFNAAHKLWNPDWSEEKNKETFGKCANENWHGHNYEIHVTVKGEMQPDTGFIFNAKRLSVIINEHICDKIDHKNLNIDVEFMKGQFTTAENLTVNIWKQLQPVLKAEGVDLHCVKLMETPRIFVEYYG
ncbi:6-carboxytetrahydropterin synthase [Ferruginibacter lapsinanis]|uniref:6-pyruvoyl trahydropterin synthase family protein n=1 Tax=Ferruginibacter lapsinanis TaxID=563172 RepID=UPI001E403777|nr:6-carboxytetrahydropterin synthase [Ferruginibacter lapsinanis]UEG48948.1 6-carboxytetrahydropterin synthase [Ferruginibacter lapsinanis]